MTSTHPSTGGDVLPTCPDSPGHVCRRTVLAGAGAVGAGAFLAACGSAGQAVGDAASQATDAVKQAISKATIPVGGGTIFPDAKLVVTQPTSGDFKAFTAVCTHQGCIVSDVSGGTINCACHGSRYDMATGAVVQGPATQPLAPKSVTVSTNGITVS
jgi:Rieske Fe-S protein